MLYRTPLRLLGDLMSPKALERTLVESAKVRGESLQTLDLRDLEDILKREVFKRLQLSVPAPLAKRRIQEVLEAMRLEADGQAPEGAPPVTLAGAELETMEGAAKTFALYFDWPELQRLRAVIGVVRDEQRAGRDVPSLLREGLDLVEGLERRRSEGLVAQAADLAELKADLARVGGVGGPKVRRLDGLLKQIEEAQASHTLLHAEVERARKLTLDLRKLVESSVIQRTPASAEADDQVVVDLDLLPADAQQRLTALERGNQERDLADLARDYAELLSLEPKLQTELLALRAHHEAGELVPGGLEGFRARLAEARNAALSAQGQQLDAAQDRLEALPESPAREEARLLLGVARGTLTGGALVGDTLAQIQGILGTLEGGHDAEAIIALQRETFELERAARDVPGAAEELAPALALAREALARGEAADLSDLWASLERRMGAAAQQREGFDARADHVIAEYDRYRHLAGETIVRLGRMADTLRAQRRLGPLSGSARESYTQTLTQAEALLDEARAEFEAAREVTSSFGADALAGLLDVFGSDSALGGDGGDLFGLGNAPATAATTAPEPEPVESLSELLERLQTDQGPMHATLYAVRAGRLSFGPGGGPDGAAARGLADVLAGLDATLLTVEDPAGAWLALPIGAGTASAVAVLARVSDVAQLPGWRSRLLDAAAELRERA